MRFRLSHWSLFALVILASIALSGFAAVTQATPAATVTVISPVSIIEPCNTGPCDKDGYPPTSSNADPEEGSLAIKLVVSTTITSPVLSITDNSGDAVDDLTLDEPGSSASGASRSLDYLDGVQDNALAPGTYYVYVNLDKTGYTPTNSATLSLKGDIENYTAVLVGGFGQVSSPLFTVAMEGSASIDQNDLRWLETAPGIVQSTVGDTFVIRTKYSHQSAGALYQMLLQSYYNGRALRLEKVNLYYYDTNGTDIGSVQSGVPPGYNVRYTDKPYLPLADQPATLTSGDRWVGEFFFKVIGTGGSRFVPYFQTKPSATSNWKLDTGYNNFQVEPPGQINPAILNIRKAFGSPAVISGPQPPVAGLTTTYDLSIIVSNSGFDNANNTVVTDTIPAGSTFLGILSASQGTASYDATTSKITWNVGTLALDSDGPGPIESPSATLHFKVSVTPTASQVGTTILLNNGANTTGNSQASNLAISAGPSNALSTTAVAAATPALTVTKSASPTTYSAAGQTINYSYTVTNTGNVTLSNIALNDDKLGARGACAAATLAPSASTTCSASYVTTQADVNAGSITNVATATAVFGTQTVTASATAKVTATQTSALSLVKSASPATYSSVGEVITYTYSVKNTGNVTLNGPFSVTDNKLGTITPCGSGPLAPNATTSCTATYTIVQADLDRGSIANSATVSGNNVTSPPSVVTITANQTKSISVTKSASPATYNAVGQAITYTYKLTNTGNVTLSTVSLNDDKLGAISACAAATLAPAASTNCTATYAVTQADLDAGTIVNLATASGVFNAQTFTSTATATVTATQTRSLSLAKSATPTTYDSVGTVITYTYTVQNTGNVTLAGPFAVTDDKLGSISPCGSGPLAPSATTSCTKTYTIIQADLDRGSITNSATTSGNSVTSPPANVTVTATQSPAIKVTKTASPATQYSAVGQTISYSYTVKNTGNVTLSTVSLSDDKLGSVTACSSATLAPSASTTCSATHLVTQSDLDFGSITNVATATAQFGANTLTSTATATVTANQAPSLSLAKSASASTYATVGTVITYTYTVTNSGNVTLSGPFSVTDDKLGSIACGSGPLTPQATASCTANYTITQADLDRGSITNAAATSGNGVTSPPATVTITATQTPSLAIVKTANLQAYSAAGQIITYSYLVTNSGNVTLAGPVTVTDNKATVAGDVPVTVE